MIHFHFQGHPKVVEKLKILLKKWSEEVFKNDPELSLIPSLYNSLKAEKGDFPSEPVRFLSFAFYISYFYFLKIKFHKKNVKHTTEVQFFVI